MLGVVRGGRIVKLAATLADRAATAGSFEFKLGDGHWKTDVPAVRALVDGNKIRAEAERARAHALHARALAEVEREKAHAAAHAAEHAAKIGAEHGRKIAKSVVRSNVVTESKSGDGKGEKKFVMSITVDSNTKPKVSIEFTDDKGETIKKTFEGDLKDVDSKLKGVPESYRERIKKALGGIKTEGGVLHVQAADEEKGLLNKLQAEKILLKLDSGEENPFSSSKVSVFAPGKDGGKFRTINLDGKVDVDLVLKQLSDLPEEVREQVEQALRRVDIPKAGVKVEKSQ